MRNIQLLFLKISGKGQLDLEMTVNIKFRKRKQGKVITEKDFDYKQVVDEFFACEEISSCWGVDQVKFTKR